MPSCDGSNCGACNCNCNCETKIVRVGNQEYEDEIAKLKKKIKQLENELFEKENL